MKNWTFERKQLIDLIPAEYNPRKITKRASKGLETSLDRFGMVEPIVWNEQTGNIVGGHQKYKILVERGETEADVMIVNITPDEEVALNVTLNNPEIRGDFTPDVITLLDSVSNELDEFKKLHLDNLQEDIESMLAKAGKKKSEKTDAPSSTSPPDNDDVADDPFGDNIIVKCPDCGGRWKEFSGEIIKEDDK